MDDRHRPFREATTRAVLSGRGATPAELRQAVARGEGPEELRALVTKIREHAHRVTDEDLATLRSRHGDDELFEIIVAAAVGAAEHRLSAAMKALEDA